MSDGQLTKGEVFDVFHNQCRRYVLLALKQGSRPITLGDLAQ